LAVSRCLRRLRGCTAVANRLAVVAVQHDGQMRTRVTADGKHVVDGRASTGDGEDPTVLPQVVQASDARRTGPQLPAPRLPSDPSPVTQGSSAAPATPPPTPGATRAWGESTYAPAVRPQGPARQSNPYPPAGAGGTKPPYTTSGVVLMEEEPQQPVVLSQT